MIPRPDFSQPESDPQLGALLCVLSAIVSIAVFSIVAVLVSV